MNAERTKAFRLDGKSLKQHNNARPHSTRGILQKLTELYWRVILCPPLLLSLLSFQKTAENFKRNEIPKQKWTLFKAISQYFASKLFPLRRLKKFHQPKHCRAFNDQWIICRSIRIFPELWSLNQIFLTGETVVSKPEESLFQHLFHQTRPQHVNWWGNSSGNASSLQTCDEIWFVDVTI